MEARKQDVALIKYTVMPHARTHTHTHMCTHAHTHNVHANEHTTRMKTLRVILTRHGFEGANTSVLHPIPILRG